MPPITMSRSEVDEILANAEDPCPLGHGDFGVDIRGWITCRRCTRNRTRIKAVRQRNRRAGRHERETMFRVPNAGLRERYEALLAAGVTAESLAIAAGLLLPERNGCVRGDTRRLKRFLGLSPSNSKQRDEEGRVITYMADSVEYETALNLCRAMGVDYPAEVGV